MVGSWILGKVSKFDGLEVGPRKTENKFQYNDPIFHSLTIVLGSSQHPGNPRF